MSGIRNVFPIEKEAILGSDSITMPPHFRNSRALLQWEITYKLPWEMQWLQQVAITIHFLLSELLISCCLNQPKQDLTFYLNSYSTLFPFAELHKKEISLAELLTKLLSHGTNEKWSFEIAVWVRRSLKSITV